MNPEISGQISELLKPHRVCLLTPVVLGPPTQTGHRFLVFSLWRGHLVTSNQPLKVEMTFSYLDICSINIHSGTEVVLETETKTLAFSVTCVEDLEAMVSHMTTSLRRIFPDSCPGKLLKVAPLDLQQRLLLQEIISQEQLQSQPAPCGGFSDTYAALCDFNKMPVREEIQWNVTDVYDTDVHRRFNLLDFRHLEDRDLALAVAALSFNQWFMRFSCRDHRLAADVQEQLILLLSRSISLQDLFLDSCGLKLDFTIRMAAALKENPSSTLQSLHLSGNVIEDRGVMALCQELVKLPEGLKRLSLSRVSMTGRGLAAVSQMLLSSKVFSASLTHLDLSGNPGCLGPPEAAQLFRFLSCANSVSYLDLSDTGCPLDTVFASLSAGCCENLKHLNLSRNLFRCRKMADSTRSIQEFFSRSRQLRYVSLSETRLPPAALRLLLQGLATNTSVCGLELDLSSCELHSAGAQVIQEHISEAAGLQSLNISDNGFEDDVVTLILAVGRCRALRHLSLGRNFVLRSRNLADALHRIAQLIQDEECPLQSLSLRESKLKADVSILLRALGAPAVLTHVDVSGNHAGDDGARILARALRSNTRLKSLSWDRNNVTVRGFQDLADALERNFTLQQVLLPLSDVTKSFQKEPEKTQQAVHRIQQYLDRNNQRQVEQLEPRQLFKLQQSEKQLRHKHLQLQNKVRRLNSVEDVQVDVHTAREGLNKAVESLKLLPSLDDPQDTSHRDAVSSTLSDTVTALTSDFSRTMQELADDLRRCTEEACPQLQQASVCDYLTECVSRCCSQAHTFIRNTLLTDAAERISSALSHLKQTLKMSVAEHVADLLLHHVTSSCDPKSFILEENSGGTLTNNFQELLPVDNFPTDDYSPTFRRNKQKIDSSVNNVKPGQPIRNGGEDGRREGEDGRRGEEDRRRGGEATAGEQERLGLPSSSLATPLSVRASSPSPTASLPLSPQGRRWREGEVLDAAAATSRARAAASTPPPLRPRSTGAFKEEAAHHGGCGSQQALLSGRGSSPEPLLGIPAPMEPLPTQGQALRHFTASRPRPRRTQTPLPSSRPQEPVSKVEVSDGMCRVDEGVEEFFTKKIIPDYALRGRWEESNPAQATPPKPSPPPSDPALISSLSDRTSSSDIIPVPPPSVPSTHTRCASTSALHPSTSSSPPHPTPLTTTTTATATTLPTKNIKKKFGDFFAFKRGRGQASRGVNGGDGVKVKRPSIADLIRPLREAKDRERDRDREKGTWAESVEDANICAGATDTDGSAASSRRAGGPTAVPASMLTTATRPSETAPSHATSASNQEEEALFVSPTRSVHPGLGPAETNQKALRKDRGAGLLSEERRAKIARRFLREGKSQSLILLTGPEPEDRDHVDSQKRSSDSSCFDQRLPLLPPKMGSQPATTETPQKTEEELRKTSSEGASLDKPEPRLMFVKPRTMSSSSAESAVCLRPQLKPAVPKRPAGPPPPQKAGGAAGGGAAAAALVSPPPSISCAERVRPRSHDCTAANGHQDSSVGGPTVSAPANEWFPQVPLPRGSPGKQDRWEKSQSVTDGSIPKPCHLMKPLPQRRVVSAHEDTLSMTEELKAAFQKSPVHLQASGEDQLTCSQVNRQEAPPGTPEGAASSSRHVNPGEEDRLSSRWFSSTAPAALGPPLEENTPKPALVHPQTVANMVASRLVPGKTPSTVPDSEELPGTVQDEQIPRTVSSR